MTTIIKLEYPIEFAGATLTELQVRRPKVRDRHAAQKVKGDDADKELFLFSQLCEVSPDALLSLDEADYKRLQDAYIGFFQSA